MNTGERDWNLRRRPRLTAEKRQAEDRREGEQTRGAISKGRERDLRRGEK